MLRSISSSWLISTPIIPWAPAGITPRISELRRVNVQRPSFSTQDLGLAEVAQQVCEEQRVAFGAFVDEGGELIRKEVSAKRHRDKALGVFLAKERKRDIEAKSAAFKIELQREERVFGSKDCAGR